MENRGIDIDRETKPCLDSGCDGVMKKVPVTPVGWSGCFTSKKTVWQCSKCGLREPVSKMISLFNR